MNFIKLPPPPLWTDAYKLEHPHMFPENMKLAFNNMTPRKSRMLGVNHAVIFGTAYLKTMLEMFLTYIVAGRKESYAKILSMYGLSATTKYMERLLGQDPGLKVQILQEGTFCPIGVPFLTYWTTNPDAAFLPSYLETAISFALWKPITSATIAAQYKLEAVRGHMRTHGSTFDEAWEATMWQCHDFSMRGMDSLDPIMASGAAHLLFFNGSDSLPAYFSAVEHYDMRVGEDIPAPCNVPATEHAVMCAGTKEGELETFKRLLELYPSGIVSIVSDTWDLWHIITDTLVRLKDQIMARDGKLVVRPDSGDPVDIICGIDNNNVTGVRENCTYKEYCNVMEKPVSLNEFKGVIELLWDIFGGTVNEQGYKVLDSHIGAIYGDSITMDRQVAINKRLAAKGFATSNIVLGIGSYTYNYNTRDTLGMAVKATYVEVEENGERVAREVFKDPVTDEGTKKSAKGLLAVFPDENGVPTLKQQATWDDVHSEQNLLKFVNLEIIGKGDTFGPSKFAEIRQHVKENCRAIIAAEQQALMLAK